MSNQEERQSWSSRLAYVMTVAGATVGFGATWRFPYLVGENGGGAYVFLFCIAMIVIGIPMILVENVIGRRMKVNAIDAFSGHANGKKIAVGWKILGYTSLLGAFGILAYYMVLGGWVLEYIGSLLTGKLDFSQPLNVEYTASFLKENIHDNLWGIIAYTLLFVILNYFILVKGIVDGIERSVKYLMPILFLFLLVMVIRNVTLPGAMEGISFYLMPDFSKITPQLFVFVLGVMNTIIAVLAGFMIFPSLFSFGVPPNSGPTLVFQSLPIVFSNMWGGTLFAIIFFGLLVVAALTTSLTIYEVIITALQEKTKMGRKKAIAVTLAVIFILGNIPSVLGDNLWKDVTIIGKSIFDAFDYISGNILFILTALGSAIFVGFVLKDEAKEELGAGKVFTNLWFNYVRFVIPVIILVIFFNSL